MFLDRCVFLALICISSFTLFGQAGSLLPAATYGTDWHLGVSDVQTTTLIFPNDVVSVDRGTGDVLTQTLDEVTNIVKVKTIGEQMEPSSLTVITSGGMVYTFRITYERSPATLTYNLDPIRSPSLRLPAAHRPSSKTTAVPMTNTPSTTVPGTLTSSPMTTIPAIYYPAGALTVAAIYVAENLPSHNEGVESGGLLEFGTPLYPRGFAELSDSVDNPMGMSYGRSVINTKEVWYASHRIHDAQLSRPVATDRQEGSELKLNDIWIRDDIMYYRFTLGCNSNISYDIDFWRFYVIDAKQRKRTAVQERDVDLIEVYSGGENSSRVERHDERTFVVAVNKFTIPDKKRLVLEVFEQDGGRHHSLRIKNKDIVEARLIASKNPSKQAR